MDWKIVDIITAGNAIIRELHKPFNGGTLVMAITESAVDDKVSTSLAWIPDAADKAPAV